jgi:hypothetical protein
LGAEYTAESIDRALSENHERSINHGRLRITEERTDRTTAAPIGGADAGTDNEINIGDIISANDGIGSGADESGERGIKTNTGELYEKLQQIRGLNKQFNPSEQRRAAEADKRAAQQARAEAERLESEQRRSKQKRKNYNHGDEI